MIRYVNVQVDSKLSVNIFRLHKRFDEVCKKASGDLIGIGLGRKFKEIAHPKMNIYCSFTLRTSERLFVFLLLK